MRGATIGKSNPQSSFLEGVFPETLINLHILPLIDRPPGSSGISELPENRRAFIGAVWVAILSHAGKNKNELIIQTEKEPVEK